MPEGNPPENKSGVGKRFAAGAAAAVILALIAWGVSTRNKTEKPATTEPPKRTENPPTDPEPIVPVVQTSWAELDNPENDGWDAESFNDLASSQLALLGEAISRAVLEKVDPSVFDGLVTDTVSCASLLPADLPIAFEDSGITEIGRASCRERV